MTRYVAAIATLILAVVACAGNASPSESGAARSGSPVSATPRAWNAAIPVDLRYVWLGPARDIAGLGGPQAVSIIRIRGEKFDYIFGGQGEEALNSTVAVSAEGQVRLTSANTTGGCRVGDNGVYDWTTTSDGTGLTMTKVTETCTPRAAAAVGDWVRAACKDFGCLGNLDAGTHATAFFEPLGDPAALTGSWRMQYGSVSYAVPDGWANAVDDPNFYNLVPQDEYAKSVTDMTRYPGIVLLPDLDVAAQDEACSPQAEPAVGQSSDEIAARIARMPGLNVGAATLVSIDGKSATMLDVAVKEGWSRFCAVGGGVPVLRQAGAATAGNSDWDRRITAAERWRLILIDIAEGRTMGILVDSFDEPSRFDDLVSQAMPIVTSFEFHLPTS